MSWLRTALPPKTVCSYLEGSELYQQQRDRVAALAHKGFALWDQYQAARPYLFAGSLMLTAASSAAWYYRGVRRVKKGNSRIAEAHVVYPALALTGLAVAYITRPDWLLPAAAPRATATEGDGFIGWLDEKVNALRAEDPHFANKVAQRLITMPSVAPVWKQTPDHARVFIECGRR